MELILEVEAIINSYKHGILHMDKYEVNEITSDNQGDYYIIENLQGDKISVPIEYFRVIGAKEKG